MARLRKHKDVEFAVEDPQRDNVWYYKTFAEAAEQAVAIGATHGQVVYLDVLISSKAGARWWGGDWALEMYEEDPEASISQRVEIRAEDVGRIS